MRGYIFNIDGEPQEACLGGKVVSKSDNMKYVLDRLKSKGAKNVVILDKKVINNAYNLQKVWCHVSSIHTKYAEFYERNFPVLIPRTFKFFYRSQDAGRAYVYVGERTGTIFRRNVEYNLILASTNIDEFESIIIHEISHLVTWQLYGVETTTHGKKFGDIMEASGVKKFTYHDLDCEHLYEPKLIYKD